MFHFSSDAAPQFLRKLSPSCFFQLGDYALLTFACNEKGCSNKCFVIGLICLHSGIIRSVFVCLFFPGQGLDYKGVLKPDGREIMTMALTSLKDAMCNLKDGSIECQLLMLIRDNLDRFLELSQEIIKEGTKNSELRQNLDQRLAELSAFEDERDQVVGLIEMCNLIKGGNCLIIWLPTGNTSAILQNL